MYSHIPVLMCKYFSNYFCVLLFLSEGQNRVLVFVETKRSADFLATSLSQSGYPATSIHG